MVSLFNFNLRDKIILFNWDYLYFQKTLVEQSNELDYGKKCFKGSTASHHRSPNTLAVEFLSNKFLFCSLRVLYLALNVRSYIFLNLLTEPNKCRIWFQKVISNQSYVHHIKRVVFPTIMLNHLKLYLPSSLNFIPINMHPCKIISNQTKNVTMCLLLLFLM